MKWARGKSFAELGLPQPAARGSGNAFSSLVGGIFGGNSGGILGDAGDVLKLDAKELCDKMTDVRIHSPVYFFPSLLP